MFNFVCFLVSTAVCPTKVLLGYPVNSVANAPIMFGFTEPYRIVTIGQFGKIGLILIIFNSSA